MRILWHMPTLRRHGCGLSNRAVHLALELCRYGHSVTLAVAEDKTDIQDGDIHAMPLRKLAVTRRRTAHWSWQAVARCRDAKAIVRACTKREPRLWHRRLTCVCTAETAVPQDETPLLIHPLKQLDGDHDLFVSCQPEVVHAYHELDRRRPVLFVCGGTTLLHERAYADQYGMLPRLRRLPFVLDRCLKRRNESAAFKAADAVVFDSRQTRAAVIGSYRMTPSKGEVVHGAFDAAVFKPPAAYAREAARRQFGFSTSDLVLAWTGRLSPEKNLGLLIRSIPLCRQRPKCVMLVGDGPQRDELQALCRREGVDDIVAFVGVRADVRPYLHAADVFAFPSCFESFGLSLVEAMACGLPSVVLRSDGRGVRNASEEILGNEDCGLFARSNEPGAFAEAIDELILDVERRHVIGARAAARVRQNFTWSQAGRRLNELVLRLARQANEAHQAAWPESSESHVVLSARS